MSTKRKNINNIMFKDSADVFAFDGVSPNKKPNIRLIKQVKMNNVIVEKEGIVSSLEGALKMISYSRLLYESNDKPLYFSSSLFPAVEKFFLDCLEKEDRLEKISQSAMGKVIAFPRISLGLVDNVEYRLSLTKSVFNSTKYIISFYSVFNGTEKELGDIVSSPFSTWSNNIGEKGKVPTDLLNGFLSSLMLYNGSLPKSYYHIMKKLS